MDTSSGTIQIYFKKFSSEMLKLPNHSKPIETYRVFLISPRINDLGEVRKTQTY